MADENMGSIIHQGILIKSPPEAKSKNLDRWRKRYFRLWSSKKLGYYKSEKSEKPIKPPIDLNKCKSIDGHLKNKKWNNIFCLNTENRKFFLVADSTECMKDWITKLCDICGFSVGDTAPSDGSPATNSRFMDTPTASPNVHKRIHDGTTSPQSTPDGSPQPDTRNLPSYNEELPPIPPDSPNVSRQLPDVPKSESPEPVIGSPFGSPIKQNSKMHPFGSPSSYDVVPPPRLAIEEPTMTKRRKSTPSESAIKNLTIKDESYVDMLPKGQPLGSYDIVPPPRPKNELLSSMDNYDLVPKPRPVSDEYIQCEVPGLEAKHSDKYGKPPPPIPDQTYTGFEKLPGDESFRQQPTRYSGAGNDTYDTPKGSAFGGNDSIYDVPPSGDSIYDTPPIHNEGESDSIYDTPPVHDENSIDYRPSPSQQRTCKIGNGKMSYAAQNGAYEQDSIYDVPPVADSIYDTPPPNLDFGEKDDVYDIPPQLKSPGFSSPTFSDFSGSSSSFTSPADLFDFGNNSPAPRIDRTLKYASTSDLDVGRTIPPPIDRKSRPVLTASVPTFPSEVEKRYLKEAIPEDDNIYDSPPARPASRGEQANGNLAINDAQMRTSGDDLHYSDFNFRENRAQPPQLPRRPTDYSAIDPELTAAVQNVRLPRD